MLTFDEIKHIYKLDGVEIPSVTTIMKPLSEAAYGVVDKMVLLKAAEKGTAVHNAVENFIKYGFEDIADEYNGYFNAYLSWNDKYKPKVIGSEMRLYHKLMMYAGTADMLSEIDGKLVLIDYKTSYSVLKDIYGVQLEAYAQALNMDGYKIDEKRVLHLKKDGTWEEVIYPAKDIMAWKVFNSLKTIYDFTKK